MVFRVGEHEATAQKQESRVPHGSLDAPTRDASNRAPRKMPGERGTGQTCLRKKKIQCWRLEAFLFLLFLPGRPCASSLPSTSGAPAGLEGVHGAPRIQLGLGGWVWAAVHGWESYFLVCFPRASLTGLGQVPAYDAAL